MKIRIGKLKKVDLEKVMNTPTRGRTSQPTWCAGKKRSWGCCSIRAGNPSYRVTKRVAVFGDEDQVLGDGLGDQLVVERVAMISMERQLDLVERLRLMMEGPEIETVMPRVRRVARFTEAINLVWIGLATKLIGSR